MNDCPNCTATLRPDRSCSECGWTERKPRAPSEPKNAGLRWSPETPPVSALQVWTGTRWVVPAEIRAELDALKAKLTTPGAGRAVDPDQERAYLENCAKRPREQEAPR